MSCTVTSPVKVGLGIYLNGGHDLPSKSHSITESRSPAHKRVLTLSCMDLGVLGLWLKDGGRCISAVLENICRFFNGLLAKQAVAHILTQEELADKFQIV